MNTTNYHKNEKNYGVFFPKSGTNWWLPRRSRFKEGTYHWDEYNPNAKMGDHAISGHHLQIHTFDKRVIRIFFGGEYKPNIF